jgi:GNAT superfamily N-acetyltransferase
VSLVQLPDTLPKLIVRPYRPSDYDRAVEIIRAIGHQYLGRNLASWDAVFQRQDGLIWAAVFGEVPIAFAGRLDYGEGVTCLHTDIVHPDYQRRGIGTLLCLTRIASIDTEAFDVLGVYATEHSTPFYQRFGFELEAPPRLDESEGYHVHRLSLSLTPDFVQQAEDTISGCDQITFDYADFQSTEQPTNHA